MAEREQLTESSFKGENLTKRLSLYPELQQELKLNISQTKSNLDSLRREVVFQKIRTLPEFSQLKDQFNALSRLQRTRVQLALGFRKDLVDGIFGERTFIAIKTLPADIKKYSLKELSYVDENGNNLERFNKIVKQYNLENPEKVKEIQSHFQKIDHDGILGPDTLKAISSYLEGNHILVTGIENTEFPLSKKTPEKKNTVNEVIPLDTTAEDIRHKAELQRDHRTGNPQLTQVQFVNQDPLEFIDGIRGNIEQSQGQNFEKSLRQGLGIQEGEILKKRGETYVIVAKDGKERQIISDNNAENYMLAQYFYNFQKNGVLPNEKAFLKMIKGQKDMIKKLDEVLNLPENTDIKKVFETYKNSPYAKILALEEFLSLKKVEATFAHAFPQYGLEEGDQIIVDDDTGVISIFRKSGNIEVKSTEKFTGIENNLKKYEQFKADFAVLMKNPQNISKISQMLGNDILKMDFEQFFLLLTKKEFYEYSQSIKELLEIKLFTGENYKDFATKFKKYGISEKLLILIGIQSGDLINYNEEEKTLDIFRVRDGMRKEPHSIDALLDIAFSNNDLDSILQLLSAGNNAEKFKDSFKDIVRSNRERARFLFLSPRALAGDGTQSINFFGNKVLEKIITAYDLFGDRTYIKKVNPRNPKDVTIYKNTGSDFFEFRTREEKLESGDFISSLGERMNTTHGTLIIDSISDAEIRTYNEGVSITDLVSYFGKIKKDSKKKEFIEFVNKTVVESRKFNEAKQIFLRSLTEGTFENVFNDSVVSKNLTAYAVFGGDASIDYISATSEDGKVRVYKRNDALGQFLDETGNKLFLDAKSYSSIVDDREKFSTVTDFMKPEGIDINELGRYLKTVEGDTKKEQQVMEYLRKFIKDGKLQRLIRDSFTTARSDGGFTIDFKGITLCEKYLTAFDFFGDQDYLGSIAQNGGIDKEYRKDNETFILLGSPEGEKMKLKQGLILKILRKEDIDFSKYKLDSDYRLKEIGRPRFMRNPRTGVTLCAASAREFATNKLDSSNTPMAEYAFQQFYKIQQKSENGLTLGEGTVVSSKIPERILGYDEIKKFLDKLRTRGIFAAQIYMDASGDYYSGAGKAYYGHVATVVLDRDTDKYYVLDAYHNGGKPTELQSYYSERTSQISHGTGKNKKFRGVAALL